MPCIVTLRKCGFQSNQVTLNAAVKMTRTVGTVRRFLNHGNASGLTVIYATVLGETILLTRRGPLRLFLIS